MALVGTVRFYRYDNDLDNPETATIEYREDLPETHPDYEKRGTSEERTTYPKIEVLENELEDAYVIVKMCALHLQDFPNHENVSAKHWNVMYRINIYEQKDQRNQDVNQPSLEVDSAWIHIEDIEAEDLNSTNLIAYCYEHLKTQRGYEDLVND